MYDLPFDFKLKEENPPNLGQLAPIRYSCIFWADHLCFRDGEGPECRKAMADDGVVFAFLKGRFLRWLESLSLQAKLSDGVSSIRKLLQVAQVCV